MCDSRATFVRKLLAHSAHSNGRMQNFILWWEHSSRVSMVRLHMWQVRREPPARVAGLSCVGWPAVGDGAEPMELLEMSRPAPNTDVPRPPRVLLARCISSWWRSAPLFTLNSLFSFLRWKMRRRIFCWASFDCLVTTFTSFDQCSLKSAKMAVAISSENSPEITQ